MTLHINTTEKEKIIFALKDNNQSFERDFDVERTGKADVLVQKLDEFLSEARKELKDVKKISVQNSGGGWTALRVGVAAANVLAYALGVEIEGTHESVSQVSGINIVEPSY